MHEVTRCKQAIYLVPRCVILQVDHVTLCYEFVVNVMENIEIQAKIHMKLSSASMSHRIQTDRNWLSKPDNTQLIICERDSFQLY